MVLRQARHPNRLDAAHPRIIEDLLELADAGQQEAVSTLILMIADLHQNGLESRYLKKLEGLPVWELKSRSRGGIKGGARVYLYMQTDGKAVLVNAEVKDGDSPSNTKLSEVLQIYAAQRQGIKVVEG